MRVFSYCVVFSAIFYGGLFQSHAQSQALNGQIEGVVTDAAGAGVPNASITIRNIEKGSEIKVTSDESGVYRAPLLQLGTYQITVEAPNFNRLVREGVTLSAGQTATVNMSLTAGDVSATVTITSDAPIADPGKIDLGRVMNTREIQDLPLVSRNPYNFSLLQANVVGRPNTEFGVPRVSANGYARRTNFQLDGNANTQANSAGLRLVPISETFISEVQLVTNGFSAEFGNTPGLVMNNITPSGTNGFHGSASYLFRRTWMSARPFDLPDNAVKPPTTVNDFPFAVGGPIIKDRWHFYTGYEYVTRDFSGRPAQQTGITEANKQALIASGLPSEIFVASIPASQKVNFFIFRTDAQLTDAHRLTGRYIRFSNFSPNNIGGGNPTANTLERTVDLDDKSNSLAIQLASIFGSNVFNEFRYQRAHRNSIFLPTQYTPDGPSVTINNVAAFGPATNIGSVSPIQTMNQFQNNLTWTRGDHSMKFGGGVNRIYDYRYSTLSAAYTFPNLQAYLNAANGTNPLGYTNYTQVVGDPELEYNSAFYNFFAQDDWKATRRLKVNYGLRYDLYDIPDGDPNAPLEASRDFKVDKNNLSPRLGIVYALREGDRPTVVRASAGIYYDTVYLSMYEGALQQNGTPIRSTITRTPTQSGAPAFPNTLTATPTASSTLEIISPDFENMYAMHFQGQVEQGLTENLSVTVGYIHSQGRQIPVYRQINCLPITGANSTLADGRPVYGTKTTNATTGVVSVNPCTNRINPNFASIIQAESGGNSNYNALTLQLNKRFAQGYQFSFNYTLSRVRDNAQERNLQGVTAVSQTDPSNRDFDWGYGIADQRHTFSGSFVARPEFNVENRALRYLLNNNQLGFTLFAGSGETFPIISNFDLNGDGIGNDIPVGVERNGGRAPGFFNIDARYSRVIPINERFKIELRAEATNIFNIQSIVSRGGTYSGNNVNTSVVNPFTGEIVRAVPVLSPNYQESRQGQFGIKFIF
jgi:hypothetical protein